MIKGKCNEESSYSFQGHFHSKYAIWRIYVMLPTDVNIRITELESTLEDKAEDLQAKKVDKDTLGDLLISLGEKIQKK